jgi:hypothetical protein
MMQFLSLQQFDEAYPSLPTARLNPLLTREALRRTAWAVFYGDTMADAGRHGVHLVTESSFHIQLPADDDSFTRDIEAVTAPLRPAHHASGLSPIAFAPSEPPLGVAAHLLRAAALRRRVLHYNSLIPRSTEPVVKMLDDLAAFETELQATLADLPSTLSYNQGNLFAHKTDRPAFILLHVLQHNCFLMLALARLSACARDPGYADLALGFRRDRIRHALPVSRIVGDMLRLNVSCDHSIAVQAYTSIESEFYSRRLVAHPVLLFDPVHINRADSTFPTKTHEYAEALSILLGLMRRQVPRDCRIRFLVRPIRSYATDQRPEACHRMVRFGYAHLLDESDHDAMKRYVYASSHRRARADEQ